jgi:hypothetical protein
METVRSSETSLRIRTTRRCIPEDGSISSYRCENLRRNKEIDMIEPDTNSVPLSMTDLQHGRFPRGTVASV